VDVCSLCNWSCHLYRHDTGTLCTAILQNKHCKHSIYSRQYNSPSIMLYFKYTRTCKPEMGYMKCRHDTKQYVSWTAFRTNNMADSGAEKEGCSLGKGLRRSTMLQPSFSFNIAFLTKSAWLPCHCFSVINKMCRRKKPYRRVNIFQYYPIYII